jgi:putative FmdB family regulatory protein
MPIYEFRCRKCSFDFRTLVRSNASAEPVCPNCGDEKVLRLLSVTARQAGDYAATDIPCGAGGCCGAMGGAGCGCNFN